MDGGAGQVVGAVVELVVDIAGCWSHSRRATRAPVSVDVSVEVADALVETVDVLAMEVVDGGSVPKLTTPFGEPVSLVVEALQDGCRVVPGDLGLEFSDRGRLGVSTLRPRS
jgi:hypothetical protein